MQSVSSRIWTRVTVSISYDDNHYTTGTSMKNYDWPVLIIVAIRIIHSEYYISSAIPRDFSLFSFVSIFSGKAKDMRLALQNMNFIFWLVLKFYHETL